MLQCVTSRLLRRSRRLVVVAAVTLLAPACAAVETIAYDSEESCGREQTERALEMDLSTARTIEITFSSGEITPMVLNLRRQQPYRLIFTNRDRSERLFNAGHFFHSSALGGIVRDQMTDESRCIQAISVSAGETVEARLIPLRPGRYEVSESYIPLDTWGSGFGVIYVN
ncbi:MAG: hypothetical protein H6905_01115 [Hyphomicrobiales bacterium]|nr:hypothetical protein [Hyphomicrobiales bacterium]